MSAIPDTSPAARRAELQLAVRRGANWFYWIAGLSVLNSLISMFAGQWNFMFGLGITQVFDAIGGGLAAESGGAGWGFRVFALLLSLGAVSIYALFGWLAGRRKTAGFVVGMTFYTLDGVIFLVAGDLLGAGFHVFALFLMFRGFKALKEMQESPVEMVVVEAELTGTVADEVVEAIEESSYEQVP